MIKSRTRKEVGLADLTRGLIVSWDWVTEGMGKVAINKGVRPLGKVVTREDLPYMHVGASGFCIQTLDDLHWVIDPVKIFEKGRKLYFID